MKKHSGQKQKELPSSVKATGIAQTVTEASDLNKLAKSARSKLANPA